MKFNIKEWQDTYLNKKSINESKDFEITINHVKDNFASVPKKILAMLPNKSKVMQLMKKVNAASKTNPEYEDLDSDNPLFYKYETELEKGLKLLFKKLKIKDYGIDVEDENIGIWIEDSDNENSNKILSQLGFDEM